MIPIPRKQHTDETKELARARVAAGESLSKVARELGVAKSTLHTWLTDADRDGHKQAREDQKQRFIKQAWETIFKAVTVGDKRLGFVLENADSLDQAIKIVTSSSLSNADKGKVLKILASLANVPLKDLARRFKRLAKKAGFPKIRFHDLRHTHATMLLQQGIHPKIVQERLGHQTIGITMDTYSHVLKGMQKEAVKKLDEYLKNKNGHQSGTKNENDPA